MKLYYFYNDTFQVFPRYESIYFDSLLFENDGRVSEFQNVTDWKVVFIQHRCVYPAPAAIVIWPELSVSLFHFSYWAKGKRICFFLSLFRHASVSSTYTGQSMDNLSALGMVAVMVVAMEVDKVADTLMFFNFFPSPYCTRISFSLEKKFLLCQGLQLSYKIIATTNPTISNHLSPIFNNDKS